MEFVVVLDCREPGEWGAVTSRFDSAIRDEVASGTAQFRLLLSLVHAEGVLGYAAAFRSWFAHVRPVMRQLRIGGVLCDETERLDRVTVNFPGASVPPGAATMLAGCFPSKGELCADAELRSRAAAAVAAPGSGFAKSEL